MASVRTDSRPQSLPSTGTRPASEVDDVDAGAEAREPATQAPTSGSGWLRASGGAARAQVDELEAPRSQPKPSAAEVVRSLNAELIGARIMGGSSDVPNNVLRFDAKDGGVSVVHRGPLTDEQKETLEEAMRSSVTKPLPDGMSVTYQELPASKPVDQAAKREHEAKVRAELADPATCERLSNRADQLLEQVDGMPEAKQAEARKTAELMQAASDGADGLRKFLAENGGILATVPPPETKAASQVAARLLSDGSEGLAALLKELTPGESLAPGLRPMVDADPAKKMAFRMARTLQGIYAQE